MMRIAGFALASSMLVAACGGGGGGADAAVQGPDAGASCSKMGGAACFELPTMPVMAYDPANPTTPKAANFNCMKPTVVTSTTAITLAGKVTDFQSGNPVDGAKVDAFTGLDFSTPVATNTSAADGSFSLSLPSGMAKSRMNFKTSKMPDALDTYALNIEVDTMLGNTGFDRGSVSVLTANALPAFIGVMRTPGLGVLAGVARDCDGHELLNAIATVTSASSHGNTAPTFVSGPQTYYFAGKEVSTDLPVKRTMTKATKDDGLFVIIEIPPTTGTNTDYLQVWGFTSAADVAMGMAGLKLLSELQSPVFGDSVISVDMSPTEGPLP